MRKRDVDKSRDDLAAFAKLVGWPLAKWQAASLRLEARTSYVLGPRQSGKSRSVAVLAAWRAFREPDHAVLVISAGDLGAKRLLATIAEIVTSSDLLSASVIDEQASFIRLSNGSTIRSVPASPKSVRGWAVDLLVIDEATEIADSLIDVALPTTAAREGARIVFLSTGGAPLGRCFSTYMAGLDSSSGDLFRSYSWRLKDCRWVSKAQVESARLQLPAWVFEAEYEGRWSGSTDSLFSPDLLRRSTADLVLPDIDHLRGPAKLLGGVDWADAGQDQTALVAIARVPARGDVRGPVFACWPARVFAAGTEVTSAAEAIARSPAFWQVLSYETNGLGAPASQILRNALRVRYDADLGEARVRGVHPLDVARPAHRHNPTVTTAERKASGLGVLRNLAERGQLIFAREE